MSDTIDFETGAPQARHCAQCSRPIEGEYWEANGRVACPTCKVAIDARASDGNGLARFLMASALGTGACVLGAVVWWAVARFARIEAALIAIGIGWLVGVAVRAGSQGRGGWLYQLMAVSLTYLSIVLAYTVLAMGELDADTRAELGLFAWPFAFLLSIIAPVMQGWGSILSIIIIGVGLLSAWKLNRREAIAWSGPHRVLAPGETAPAPPPLPGFPAPPPLPEAPPSDREPS